MFWRTKRWVVFVEDALVERHVIYLSGMWGEVQPDPYGVCTPGISTMILAIGQSRPYGCYDSFFRYSRRRPTADEMAESLRLWKNAFPILEERKGWTGFVSVDGRILPVEKVCREIRQQVERIGAWLAGSGREKEIRGSVRRLRKLLHAFHCHPDGRRALELAASLEPGVAGPALGQILTGIAGWNRGAAATEREPTASEKLWKGIADGQTRIEVVPLQRQSQAPR